jgi:TonB family protein
MWQRGDFPAALLLCLVTTSVFGWSIVGPIEPQVPSVTAATVKKHVGQEVTVCGRVVTYDCDVPSGSMVLDLESPNWENGVSVEVGRPYWTDSSGQDFSNRYLFGRVCARGRVSRADRRHRVVVHDRDQPRVLTGSGVSPWPPDAMLICAEGVRPPVLVREVKPTYTREAMRHKLQGKVYLEALVLPDGSVGDVRLVYGLEPDDGLNQQAASALKQWRFRAGSLGGRPVPVVVTVELSFTLR